MEKESENIIVLSEIDSTNNYANRLITDKSAINGTVVLAQHQKHGRGQRENHWHSEHNKNLLASYIFFPTFLPAPLQFFLSKITSIAMIEWLLHKNIIASIKWPNDIYVENKKIAGILIETSIMGSSIHSAVAGVGFNLNQTNFSNDLPNPISVKQLTGIEYDILQTAVELRDIILNLYQELQNGRLDELHTTYLNHLFRYNEWSLFKKDGKLFEARIAGIGEFGHILIENRNGQATAYAFKEIEFVI